MRTRYPVASGASPCCPVRLTLRDVRLRSWAGPLCSCLSPSAVLPGTGISVVGLRGGSVAVATPAHCLAASAAAAPSGLATHGLAAPRPDVRGGAPPRPAHPARATGQRVPDGSHNGGSRSLRFHVWVSTPGSCRGAALAPALPHSGRRGLQRGVVGSVSRS